MQDTERQWILAYDDSESNQCCVPVQLGVQMLSISTLGRLAEIHDNDSAR